MLGLAKKLFASARNTTPIKTNRAKRPKKSMEVQTDSVGRIRKERGRQRVFGEEAVMPDSRPER